MSEEPNGNEIDISHKLDMEQNVNEENFNSKTTNEKRIEFQIDSKIIVDAQNQDERNSVVTNIDKNSENIQNSNSEKTDANESNLKPENNIINGQREEAIDNCESNKNASNDKELNNKAEKSKSSINPSTQKSQKEEPKLNTNNNIPRPNSVRKKQRITSSQSQAVVYNRPKKQNANSPSITAQNASASTQKGNVHYSMTSPSNIRYKSKNKNGLFERSLKKPTKEDSDSDDYLNFTFTYSNPYYGSKKKPIVSNITSESDIINEVNKRKIRGEKEKEDFDEMNNQQFKVSDYNKKLAKRALIKKNERQVKRTVTPQINDDYDQDIVFLDDQILPDDTEVKKFNYYRKLPSYLSQVTSFRENHKDVIKTIKEQEMLKIKKSRK